MATGRRWEITRLARPSGDSQACTRRARQPEGPLCCHWRKSYGGPFANRGGRLYRRIASSAGPRPMRSGRPARLPAIGPRSAKATGRGNHGSESSCIELRPRDVATRWASQTAQTSRSRTSIPSSVSREPCLAGVRSDLLGLAQPCSRTRQHYGFNSGLATPQA